MRFLLLLLAVCFSSSLLAADSKPNIVLVFIDDLGCTDLGCYGSKFYESPNVDRLAREGLRFTQAYSACTVCSPSRAALMTGKSPAALKVTDWIAGHQRPYAKLRVPDWKMYLPPEEETIAEALHRAGYVSAHIGKWHLGPEPATTHGFDVTIADNGKGQPASYLSPYKNPNLPDGPPGEHLSDRLTSEAVHFIEQNKDKPFFLYLAHYAVHTPLGGKPEVIAKFEKKPHDDQQKNPIYASMVESVDDSVGRLRAKLEELKLTERTIFIFYSDNGGLLPVTYNYGVRAGKGSAYEGGVRVPLIVSWPGLTKPGTETAVPVIGYDWFPTFMEAAGVQTAAKTEGVSLLPALRGGTLPDRPLFWHYPHYHPGGATPYSAVREGPWKAIEFLEDGHLELYNLQDDPMEQHNLAAAPGGGKAAELKAKLDAWRQSVGAQMPTPNPDFDAEKDKQTAGKKKKAA